MPYYMFDAQGAVRGEYESLADLVQRVHPGALDIVQDAWSRLSEPLMGIRGYEYHVRTLVVDECGLIVSRSHLASVRNLVSYTSGRGWVRGARWYRIGPEFGPEGKKFRDGHVPGTRKYKASSRSGHRWFRHMFEHRACEALRLDEEARDAGIRPRGKRKNMPNVWDDLPYEYRKRTWKQYRRTQYKPVDM